MRRRYDILCLFAVLLGACGVSSPAPKSVSLHQALTNNAEYLEFESPATRQELLRELVKTSQLESGQTATSRALFPIVQEGQVIAGKGLGTKIDLLQGPPLGVPSIQFTFHSYLGEAWPEDARDSLQGLSERETAELVARALVTGWNIQGVSVVQVDRISGAPYAAAYVDGILRINPSFLYIATAAEGSLFEGGVQ